MNESNGKSSGILSMQSGLMRGLTQAVNVVLLSFWFWVGCLPVVTIGASLIAVYRVALKMTYDEDDYVAVTSEYWKGFKQNWKHGVLYTLLGGAALYSAWMAWQLFEAMDGNPMGFLLLAVLLVFVVALHALYTFPLEARYSQTVRITLRNARRMVRVYWQRTFIIIGLLAIEFLFFFTVNSFLVLLGRVFGPVVFILTISGVITPALKKIEKENGIYENISEE